MKNYLYIKIVHEVWSPQKSYYFVVYIVWNIQNASNKDMSFFKRNTSKFGPFPDNQCVKNKEKKILVCWKYKSYFLNST